MKSAMAFHGVAMPDVRRLCRHAFSARPMPSQATWLATVDALWREAEFREERYAAVELLAWKPCRPFRDAAMPDFLGTLIVSGAWWDYVDPIAINQVGPLLETFPDDVRPTLQAWCMDADIWLRRTAILAQLKFKADTDWPLQQQLMAPSLTSDEFFLRKGIGWALREYSKTAPDEVLDYVRTNAHVLSGLSKREGLKVLLKDGRVSRDDPLFTRG